MGVLRHVETGVSCELRGRHRVGRSPTADLRIEADQVSGDHALLRWELGTWVVQDLSSTNGTFLGGVRLAPGEPTPVGLGERLGFGTPAEQWELVDDAAPVAFAAAAGGLRCEAQDGQIRIPDAAAPRVVVRLTPEVGWSALDARGSRRVGDGEEVFDGERAWTLHLPEVLPKTRRSAASRVTVADAELVVRPSLDHEHVELLLHAAGAERSLGAPVYGHIVLALVDQMLEDRRAGHIEAECGWVEKTRLETRLNPNQLNVWLHRFKRSLAEAGVMDSKDSIQTRERGRRIRLVVPARRDG